MFIVNFFFSFRVEFSALAAKYKPVDLGQVRLLGEGLINSL